MKKLEESRAIAELGVPVVIAEAGSEAGRLACLHSVAELRELRAGGAADGTTPAPWRGTLVTSAQS
jgi:hypothetical protein